MVKISRVLGWLTVCIALVGYLPLQPYLGPLARWFFPASLAVGLYLQKRGTALPPRMLTLLSIAFFLYLASGFTLDRLILITADLLVIFLGVRMLGERSGRHCLQVFALSLFCLAASSLYNLSALFLVYLLLLLLLIAISLVVLTFHAHDAQIALGRREAKKVLGVSCLMPLASLPILLLLFVLLPRTPYPLWHFLNQSATKATGFSDRVNPGSSSSVAELKGVVLRAICAKLPEQKLYWRGVVLNGFSENAWVRLPPPPERGTRVERGVSVAQEIYPEPSAGNFLPALNIPRSISGIRYLGADDAVYASQRPLDRRVKYQVLSTLAEAIAAPGAIDRAFYLRLPSGVSPRMRAKGSELARTGLKAEQKLQLLESFFRQQRIAYANAGLPTGPDPLDSFLFGDKRGNCEFFASSLATLLRLAGVPSRLVGGYRGGNYNEMGGYYLVTEDMAHVWVEAYLDGRGWVSVDPSAWSVGFTRRQSGARELRMYADAIGFYWNKAVITYDLDRQIALLMNAGGKARNFKPAAGWWRLPVGLALALLSAAALRAWYRRPAQREEERVLRRFRRALRRRYPMEDVQQEGLFELAQRIRDPLVTEFVDIYGAAVYGDRSLRPDQLTRLKEILAKLLQHRS